MPGCRSKLLQKQTVFNKGRSVSRGINLSEPKYLENRIQNLRSKRWIEVMEHENAVRNDERSIAKRKDIRGVSVTTNQQM